MGLFSFFKKGQGKTEEETTGEARPFESDGPNGGVSSQAPPEKKAIQSSRAVTGENGPGAEIPAQGDNLQGDDPQGEGPQGEDPQGEDPSGEEPAASLQPECSIYEYIKAHTEDGRLPEGFNIPWVQGMWAPGAQDGVYLYHMVPLQPDPAREQKILEALTIMSEAESTDAADAVFDIFEELEERASIVRLYDEIIQVIADHQANLNLVNLLNFGDWLICYGVSLLSVKLGLTVISPFNVPFVEEVMTEFGVYDEFTYYAARVLSQGNWKNGNEELFALAKNVRGWGRIHAVEYLQPETQEIRDWLLYEGANNDIVSQYSADVCLQKAGAESRLDSGLSAREFEAIGELIGVALESGPRPGITDGERILPKFLAKEGEFPIGSRLKQMILNSAGEYGLAL